MSGKIFVNYRRSQSGGWAATAIKSQLQVAFGKERVFIDVDGIRPADEWPATIDEEIASAAALVVVMEDGGHKVCDEKSGKRRIDQDNDWVREEIRISLERKPPIPIFPLRLDSADLPDPDWLPEDIRGLLDKQAFHVRQTHATEDLTRLIREIADKTPFVPAEDEPNRSKRDRDADPSEIFDFSLERLRHGEIFGRDDVIEELDRRVWGQRDRGWVLVTGSPGIGKSAILHHYLCQLEAREDPRLATGRVPEDTKLRPIPHHFIRRGQYGWDQAEAIRSNLAARIEAMWPEHARADARPEMRLSELLLRVSQAELEKKGRRLVLVVDGLDEAAPLSAHAEGKPNNPLQAFLPHVVPPGVVIVCASRPDYPNVSWLEARDWATETLNLDSEDWVSSNEKAVTAFWHHHWNDIASRFRPPLDPAFRDEAITCAGGNLLHAKRLKAQVEELPPDERPRAELIPRGLDNLMAQDWWRIVALPDEQMEQIVDGLALLCSARESLPLRTVLGLLDCHSLKSEDRFLRAARPFLIEEPGYWRGEKTARYRPYHDFYRAFVLDRVQQDRRTRMNRVLGERLAVWPAETELSDKSYALHHGVWHRLEAGDWQGAYALCTCIDYLESKCEEVGVYALEQDLERATALVPKDDGRGDLLDILRSVRFESSRIRAGNAELDAQLFTQLLCRGWQSARIRDVLGLCENRPALALRHPIQMGQAVLRNLEGHSDLVRSCTVTPDGKYVVSASSDKTLKVWELDSGQCINTLEGHSDLVRSCTVTADGKHVVSASLDNTLKVWELQSGQCKATLYGPSVFFGVVAVENVICCGDAIGNVWILDSPVLSM